MQDKLNPPDPLVEVNAALLTLWREHGYNPEQEVRRKNGLEMLGKLGVSTEARTVVASCYVLEDVVWGSSPYRALNLPDAIPIITNAVVTAKNSAQKRGNDLRGELGIVKEYLENVETLDREDARELPMDFYDWSLSKLMTMVTRAVNLV